ncbi:6-phosphogluconolactonase [Syntrophus aciditrophicus]|uniref:6-phosphogluconolactonase/glucosamine-6-phosphate isomerase/deaminase n=1 Tax=Syntrophus aciditrophicus (strain SB) TaxID=56780 RepID=Q2LRC0_SYNAS|nr:6-phosphogluconolactonase [Syntrophus aciditrophicus]ABC76633.1 6-phosphogluconolactonase/glucosamine-6-phosphate isomerase/deaminase [Syntrophus aciditrophicus SB]OPY16916.1 MAG: Glucosamine-6-phosphate deaminase 1 [Syntrophus sp. PtaB.Bin075]
MSFKVIVTRDFEHMSEVAAGLVIENIRQVLKEKDIFNLGLATGNSPTGLYKHLARAANEGSFDSGRIRSFNLDEYCGLPGENAQQRALHPESYSFFMIQELFGLLDRKFKETYVPWGTLIDQGRLIEELAANPADWKEVGADKGKAIVIDLQAKSEYLRWVRKSILDAYVEKISGYGGIDLHIIGVGGRGHVAFHESGIPFEGNSMLLVKLDENTIENAVKDGHFVSRNDSPSYAVSMGAELVYKARTVVLLANGARKTEPIAESILDDPSPLVPISYGKHYARQGGRMIYVLDKAAAEKLLRNADAVKKQGIELDDLS